VLRLTLIVSVKGGHHSNRLMRGQLLMRRYYLAI
jgi:hypothetical protein